MTLEAIEQEAIRAALARHDGNVVARGRGARHEPLGVVPAHGKIRL